MYMCALMCVYYTDLSLALSLHTHTQTHTHRHTHTHTQERKGRESQGGGERDTHTHTHTHRSAGPLQMPFLFLSLSLSPFLLLILLNTVRKSPTDILSKILSSMPWICHMHTYTYRHTDIQTYRHTHYESVKANNAYVYEFAMMHIYTQTCACKLIRDCTACMYIPTCMHMPLT